MNPLITFADAFRILLPSYKSLRDNATSGQMIENTQGRIGYLNSGIGDSGKQIFKKAGVMHWRMWAEYSWAVRTAIDIHRNFSTLIEPAVVPINPKLPYDKEVQRIIEDLLTSRMSNGDSYAEVKEKMLEDYFVLSTGAAELWLKRNGKPYNITPLDASRVGFYEGWDGSKLDSPRYAELTKDYSRIERKLSDSHVMAMINRKTSYNMIGISHVEVLDMAVQGLFAGDDQMLMDLKYPAASGALSLGENISPDRADEVRSKIMAAAKHAFVVISGTKDPKFVPFKPRDMKMLDKNLWFLREVAAVFGLPITIFAQSADSTRANTVALLDQMGEGLKDTAMRIKKMENFDILRKFGDPKKLNLQIDYPILRMKDALKQAELSALQLGGQQGFISINEARRDNGQESLPYKIADDVFINTPRGLATVEMLQSMSDSGTLEEALTGPQPGDKTNSSGNTVDGEIVDETPTKFHPRLLNS